MLSLSHQFLFVHIPKTAGNSIQNVLRAYSCDEVDSSAPHQDGVERFGVRSARYRTHKHSTLAQYRGEYGEAMLAAVFKFACVRNPWERAISYYFSPHRGTGVWDRADFARFVPAITPVNAYLTLDGESAPLAQSVANLDAVIHFENLTADFERVCRTIGIPPQPLVTCNRSDRRPYREYYDAELADLVRGHFSDEINHFGYEF